MIALLWSSLRSRVALAASSLIILIAVVLAVAAPFLPLPDPSAMEAIPYTPPGAEHWLGTDNFGRDVFSRLVWGTQLALMVAIVSSAIASLLGIVLGSVAGYFGGTVDAVLSRSFDVFLLIPSFFLVLLIVALFGSGIGYTMLAIALTTWPRSARIMRAQVLSLKSRVYVQAARSAGASHLRTLLRHVVPNGLAPIVTDATILMGLAILTEAGLSFLGLGDQNAVSWGRMIFEGQRQLRLAPWMSFFPGLALLVACGVTEPARRRAQPGPEPPASPPCRPRAAPTAAGHDGRGGRTAAGRAGARGARADHGLRHGRRRASAPWTTCPSFCRGAAASASSARAAAASRVSVPPCCR